MKFHKRLSKNLKEWGLISPKSKYIQSQRQFSNPKWRNWLRVEWKPQVKFPKGMLSYSLQLHQSLIRALSTPHSFLRTFKSWPRQKINLCCLLKSFLIKTSLPLCLQRSLLSLKLRPKWQLLSQGRSHQILWLQIEPIELRLRHLRIGYQQLRNHKFSDKTQPQNNKNQESQSNLWTQNRD